MAVFAGGSGSGGGGGQDDVANPTYYLSALNGNDTTGNGSFDKPFATFNKLNHVLFMLHDLPSVNAPFTIFVEGGFYGEGNNNGVFFPNCIYRGYGSENVFVSVNDTITFYVPAIGLVRDATSVLGLYGMNLQAAVLFDLNSVFSTGCTLHMAGVYCGDNFSWLSGTGDIIARISNSYFAGNFTLQDAVTNQQAITDNYIHTFNCNSQNFPSGSVFINNCTFGNCNLTSNNSEGILLTMQGCLQGNIFTVSGTPCALNIDGASLPVPIANFVLVGSPTISLIERAYGIGYIPSVSNNWATAPVSVQGALDSLGASTLNPISVLTTNTALVQNGSYIVNGSGQLALTMPTMTVGKSFVVYGAAGGWQLTLPGASSIKVGNLTATTTITSGTVTDGLTVINYASGVYIGIPTTGSSLVVV